MTNNVLHRPLFTNQVKGLKSTEDVLKLVCKLLLCSTGFILKLLKQCKLGGVFAHKQLPIDELDFKITNFGQDFRNGLLLARLAEIYAKVEPKSLLAKLHIPASTLLRRKTNVTVVFEFLKKKFDINLVEKHIELILHGSKEKVLHFLWCICSSIGKSLREKSAATGTPTVESPAHWSGQEDVVEGDDSDDNNLDSGSAATGKRTVHAAAESPASTCSFSSSVTEVRKVDQSVQPFISDGEYDGYSISDGVGDCEALRQARELLSRMFSDLSRITLHSERLKGIVQAHPSLHHFLDKARDLRQLFLEEVGN